MEFEKSAMSFIDGRSFFVVEIFGNEVLGLRLVLGFMMEVEVDGELVIG